MYISAVYEANVDQICLHSRDGPELFGPSASQTAWLDIPASAARARAQGGREGEEGGRGGGGGVSVCSARMAGAVRVWSGEERQTTQSSPFSSSPSFVSPSVLSLFLARPGLRVRACVPRSSCGEGGKRREGRGARATWRSAEWAHTRTRRLHFYRMQPARRHTGTGSRNWHWERQAGWRLSTSGSAPGTRAQRIRSTRRQTKDTNTNSTSQTDIILFFGFF